MQIRQLFIVLRQPFAISVSVFSNPRKLTNYIFILPIKLLTWSIVLIMGPYVPSGLIVKVLDTFCWLLVRALSLSLSPNLQKKLWIWTLQFACWIQSVLFIIFVHCFWIQFLVLGMLQYNWRQAWIIYNFGP